MRGCEIGRYGVDVVSALSFLRYRFEEKKVVLDVFEGDLKRVRKKMMKRGEDQNTRNQYS
jgi:hypothetical protein